MKRYALFHAKRYALFHAKRYAPFHAKRYAQGMSCRRMARDRTIVSHAAFKRRLRWLRYPIRTFLSGILAFCVASAAWAQEATLPIAPNTSVQGPESVDRQSTGTIEGTLVDTDGALVPNARVKLTRPAVETAQIAISDHEGHFQFADIGAGPFLLTVAADGLAAASVSGTLKPGQIDEVPPIQLRVAAASSEVTVPSMTRHEIAVEEVHAEEKQRVIGLVPNYFVTYDRSPAPLTAKQKFGLGWHAVRDPTNFLFAGLGAGIEQAEDTFPGYGRGAQGYGKRYGASLAGSTSSTLLRGSVYPAIFHQDPRYFYKGTGTVWQRAKYALATAVICRGDNGRWEPNYSGVLGDLSAGALSNLYYPASSRHGAALTFEDGLLSTAGVGIGHLFQEFLFRKLSPHVAPSGGQQP